MKKKFLKWAVVPMMVALAFVGLSSFVGESEESGSCVHKSCTVSNSSNKNCNLTEHTCGKYMQVCSDYGGWGSPPNRCQ